MLSFTNKDLVKYVAEIFVVVLGILIAFQVEEWRNDFQIERDRQAVLERLKEETRSNLTECESALPFRARLARSVQLVLESIQSGKLHDTDVDDFEFGLTHIGFLPRSPYLSTVAEEMIATGLLKELENADLQTSISSAQVQIEVLRQTVATQSLFLQPVVDELARSVDYSYAGTSDLEKLRDPGAGVFEESIDVSYEFASLAENRYLKNLLVEASDGHIDLYAMDNYLCATIEQIDKHLAEHGLE